MPSVPRARGLTNQWKEIIHTYPSRGSRRSGAPQKKDVSGSTSKLGEMAGDDGKASFDTWLVDKLDALGLDAEVCSAPPNPYLKFDLFTSAARRFQDFDLHNYSFFRLP